MDPSGVYRAMLPTEGPWRFVEHVSGLETTMELGDCPRQRDLVFSSGGQLPDTR